MASPVIVMAAPNGARKTRADHPALPMTIEETVAEAVRCQTAGAVMLHAHVRDAEGEHVLDAGLYRELVAEVGRQAPDLIVQVTTEAVGRYTPNDQIRVAREVVPEALSVALREIAPDAESTARAGAFYSWAREAGVHVQHILYDDADVRRFSQLIGDSTIPRDMSCALYVLGRYSAGQESTPADLATFTTAARESTWPPSPWFVCAFGPQETACVARAVAEGGHARVGFENNIHLPNGDVARDNAALVAEAVTAARRFGRPPAGSSEAREILGIARSAP